MKSPFSESVKFNVMDYTPAYFRLTDCIDVVISYINMHGGFTVIGWYRRGEINDISNDEVQNKVDSSEIGYHIVSMYPTNKTILKNKDLLDQQFDLNASVDESSDTY